MNMKNLLPIIALLISVLSLCVSTLSYNQIKDKSVAYEKYEIPTETVQGEVIDVSNSVYKALIIGQGTGDREGFEFHQDVVWANELLNVGDKVDIVINKDTGELIYVSVKDS